MSEPAEVQEALSTVSQALVSLKEHKTVTWLLDSGFDDVAVWRTIWEQQEHLVSRIYHTDRKVAFQVVNGVNIRTQMLDSGPLVRTFSQKTFGRRFGQISTV